MLKLPLLGLARSGGEFPGGVHGLAEFAGYEGRKWPRIRRRNGGEALPCGPPSCPVDTAVPDRAHAVWDTMCMGRRRSGAPSWGLGSGLYSRHGPPRRAFLWVGRDLVSRLEPRSGPGLFGHVGMELEGYFSMGLACGERRVPKHVGALLAANISPSLKGI